MSLFDYDTRYGIDHFETDDCTFWCIGVWLRHRRSPDEGQRSVFDFRET